MKELQIEIYQTLEGDRPFEEWFLKLTSPIRASIQNRLDRISKGHFGDIKKITGAKGLFEIRLHTGPGYRIYFSKHKDKIVILLCGGMKKSQDRDIKKAQNYLIDYLHRKNS